MTFAFWSLDTKQLNHQLKPWKNHWLWLVVLWMLELFDVPVEVIGTTVSSSLHVFLIQLNRTNPSPARNPQIHGHLSFGSASLHSGFPSFSVARKLWSANLPLAGEGEGAFLKYDISTFPPEKNCCCCASGKIFLVCRWSTSPKLEEGTRKTEGKTVQLLVGQIAHKKGCHQTLITSVQRSNSPYFWGNPLVVEMHY